MSETPRLGAKQPLGYTCVREVGLQFGDRLCDDPAIRHVRWNLAGENAPACDKDFGEAMSAGWVYDWHYLEAACMIPGSLWFIPEDRSNPSFCHETDPHPDLAALAAESLEATR